MHILDELEKIFAISSGTILIILSAIIAIKIINLILYWNLCKRIREFENSQEHLFEQLETISTNLYLISLKIGYEKEEDKQNNESDIPNSWIK